MFRIEKVLPSLAGKITKSHPHGMKNMPRYKGVIRSGIKHNKLSIFILSKLSHFHSSSCKKISQYLNLIFCNFVPKIQSNRINTLRVCILNHGCWYNLLKIRMASREKIPISSIWNMSSFFKFLRQFWNRRPPPSPSCLTETKYEQMLLCTWP